MINISEGIILFHTIAMSLFFIATITDIKNNTITIGLFPALIPIAYLFNIGCFGPQWLPHVIAGIGVGIGFLITAILGKVGGGDVIMYTCLALCHGPYGIGIILLGVLICIVIAGACKIIKEKFSVNGVTAALTMSIPLAPFTMAGYILYTVVRFWTGGIPL